LILFLVKSSDILIVCLASVSAYWLYVPHHVIPANNYIITTLLAAALLSRVLQARGGYTLDKLAQPQAQLGLLISTWALVCAILIAGAFLLKISDSFSRGWALLWFCGSLGATLTSRIVLHRLLNHRLAGLIVGQRAVIVGATEIGRRVMKRVEQTKPFDLNVLGIFDDRMERLRQSAMADNLLGQISDIPEFVRRNTVDVVIVALPLMAEQRVLKILATLQQLPVDVRFATDLVGFHIANPTVSNIAGVPMLHAAEIPFKGWRALAKDVEDRVLATIFLLLLGPFMLLIALAIRIDSPGPALFRQPRRGFNSKPFKVYKFRTMRTDLAHESGSQLTAQNDPRITRLGAILRKTSLDELPQILNVLRGEMSIVGPRPHAHSAKAADKLYPDATANYMARYRVRPGITGWAQVNGWRGPTDTYEQLRQRVEHDLYYIENWSLWLDLRIIAMTAVKGFWGKNAF